MSKLSRIINKQLLKTVLPCSFSLKSSPVTKSPLKNPNFLTPVIINLTPKQSFLFSYTRVINSNPRSFCSSSSPHSEIKVNQTSSEEVTDSTQSIEKGVSIPVRAYYKFNRIDLKGLMDENQANLIPHTSGNLDYALLKFGNGSSQTPSQDSEAKLSVGNHSYMVVFPYGSTVMFNVLDSEVDEYLKIIKRHASVLAEAGKDGESFQNYHIKFEVRENLNLPMWMQGGQGCLTLQHLDTDGICAISSVLGISIALDYYVRKVDGVIAAFTELPRGRWTIRSYIMRKKRMYQLVGRANSTLAELFVKLELFERSEIAFLEDPNYSRMLEHLKDQFELNQKIAGLDFYLRLMERFVEFVGAHMNRGYILIGQSLVVICAVLVYYFSPFTVALYSLADSIMIKYN